VVICTMVPAARLAAEPKNGMRFIQSLTAVLVISLAPASLAQQKPPESILSPFHTLADPFYEGCCVIPSIPRPKNLSRTTVPATRLHKALYCAMNNDLVGGTRALAKDLGDRTALHVAYHYGNYMADEPCLTLAVYSVDGKHGVLFDGGWDSSEYFFTNLHPLLRTRKQWRVGEIHGGLSSYTRLWHLAQEISLRPRMTIPIADIERAKPASCLISGADATGWKPDK
jgi:hypothetical protein